jgi:elongation factor P
VASTADIKNGLVLQIDGQLWQMSIPARQPGKGPPSWHQAKNEVSARSDDKTYNAV